MRELRQKKKDDRAATKAAIAKEKQDKKAARKAAAEAKKNKVRRNCSICSAMPLPLGPTYRHF